MKTYSIGRDLNCDIVVNDSTDVISRRHALLNIAPSGKMTIIDQSSNGTYVNGIRISQNVPVPVTRKDIVSLAHVAKLDWSQVPRPNNWMKYVIIACISVVVILGIIFGIKNLESGSNNDGSITSPNAEQVDSVAIKQREAARLDSIKNTERQDSIKKAAKKSKQNANQSGKNSNQSGKETQKTNEKDKSKGNKDKDNSSQTEPREIG